MSKQTSQSDYEAILRSLEKYSEGATLKEIQEGLKISLSHRTLQRRLASLVKEGDLYVQGMTRSLRYRVPVTYGYIENGFVPMIEEGKGIFIPLSSEAETIIATVSKPIEARVPVGYNCDFLDKYRPNITYYLSEQTRQRLFEMGKPEEDAQPPGTYVRKNLKRFLIDLTWNSSRLEENNYSLLETKRLIESGKLAEGKDLREAQMLLNHKAALDFLVASTCDISVNRYTILNLHALLSNNLLSDQRSCGHLRSISAPIAKTVYQPLALPQLIKEQFQQLIDKACAIHDPIEQAFFLMVHLPYLHPFENMNKRVSRLAANIPLILKNLCPLSFVDIPQQTYMQGLLGIFELNRTELLRDLFVWAYERSCALYSTTHKFLAEPDPFRFRYRNLIIETVRKVVRRCMDKEGALVIIKQHASEFVHAKEQARFIEVVEIDLLALHEGKIACYQLRPSEYELWQKTWEENEGVL